MNAYIFQEDIITKSEYWRVPEAENQEFEVTLYGGGGSGSIESFENNISGAGGGSGYVSKATLTLQAGEEIEIIIAEGGKGAIGKTAKSIDGLCVGNSGGTSFFGKYLSAAGGLGGYAGKGGDGYYDGGDSGLSGQGSVISNGCNSQLSDNISYKSGGGAGAPDSIGRGGSADWAIGDAGAAAGGAGAMVLKMADDSIVRRIGSGGPGICIIRYNKKI